MKKLFIITLLLTINNLLFAGQPKYSEVKISLDTHGLTELARLGIPLDEGQYRQDGFFTCVLSDQELRKIKTAGFRYDILQEDYSATIAARNQALTARIQDINRGKGKLYRDIKGNYPVPDGFSLGSVGGFYTLDEVNAQLDSLSIRYPDLCTPKMAVSATPTIEGRTVYYVKISKNPNVNEDEPKVLYDGLIHAREPIGMQSLFFFVDYLLENYATDPEIKYMLDHAEIYFVPVMNPDGYQYNCDNDPYGGGMWRKNRRNNGSGYFGIDLNRNFGYQWGYDNNGSSPSPMDETYRGTAGFSEPETQIIREFCSQHHLSLALNNHAYAGLFLYPWSYITYDTPDSLIFVTFGQYMTHDNQYPYGTPGALLYNTNGDANDWMYGDQTTKPKVFSFTPEIGTNNDNFWPNPDRIIPLCQESMLMNLLGTKLVLKYAKAKDFAPVIISGKQGYFPFHIERDGLDSTGVYTVSIQSLDGKITGTDAPKVFQDLKQFVSVSDSLSYTLDPSINNATSFRYLLQVNNGAYTHSDTVTKWYGAPLAIFSDSCNTMNKWTSDEWGVSTQKYFSPPGSLTDSPSGNYGQSEDNSITMIDTIGLKNSPVAVINYMTRWSVEKSYDYVQIKISADDGLTWTPLSGLYTHPGVLTQMDGSPLYDGIQNTWVREQIVLTNYINKNIKLRFTLRSDAGVIADGFYVDDFKVQIIDMAAAVPDLNGLPVYFISTPVPNPAQTAVTVNYRIPAGSEGRLIIFDASGGKIEEIFVSPENTHIRFSVSGLAPGIYYYRITTKNGSSGTRKLIII
ncbi:MAG: M14 family zinc carboxypeptidase [Bacteroidetes bacterium]|nr:M14 family zinc carboxypeptidase [Bacteroidota bacterium]